MVEHLRLYRTLLERQLRAWHLAPWVVYVLAPILFAGLCYLLILRSEHLSWAIVFFGLSAIKPLSEARRNDFFRGIYRGGKYRSIRLLENGLVLLPFVLFLLLSGFWAGALVLGVVGMSGVWYTDRPRSARSLPTPFSARPFEYAAAFRRFWWLLLIVVFLLGQAVRVGNFELGGFALAVLLLLGNTVAQEAEPGFYVWIHSLTPPAFLRRKLLLFGYHQLLLTLPVILCLLFVFPHQWLVVALITLIGTANIALSLLMKYSHFPHRLHVGHGFVMLAGLVVFPTLVILIPLYYQRARARVALHLPDA